MSKAAHLIGERFGRLTVISLAEQGRFPSGGTYKKWECLCDCGNSTLVFTIGLRSGNTTSCGCFHKERASISNKTHGHSTGLTPTKTYQAWQAMLTRVRNPNQKQAKDYHSRGITIDPSWEIYEIFLTDMGECPLGYSLDRKDNNGNYNKENCRWATPAQQNRNKSNSRFVFLNGEKINIVDAAKKLGITHMAFHRHAQRKNVTLQEAVDHFAETRTKSTLILANLSDFS